MQNQPEHSYMLSDLVGLRAVHGGKRIGTLADIIVTDAPKLPEVTFLRITRSFGYPALMVPWDRVGEITRKKIELDVVDPQQYEADPAQGQVCLKDHLLDKKVLDCDDDEVEVVYDIKLAARNGKLFVTDVDCSRAAFLRRIGLKRLSNFIRGLAATIKEDTIPWSYVQQLPEDISAFRGNVKLNVLKAKLPEIHPVDLAEILEELDHEERVALFSQLETEQASDTLEEAEPRVQRDLISSLSKPRAAELIGDMTPAQAADLMAVLPASEVDEILALIDPSEADKIRHLLEHHDDKVAGFATGHFIALPPDAEIRTVLGEFHTLAKDADVVMYVYVVGDQNRLLGVIDIKELLRSDPADRLADQMTTNLVTLTTDSTIADASKLFVRYSFRAIPVVDENETIVGVIPYRDVMDLKHRFV
jgi:CBS domain-containing protein/sporulation protein YlmC with PRC-barrel domain